MTPDRDIERLLDTWFADGPDGPPDRVVEGVADRIARQAQRPAWRLHGRPSPVPTTALRVALAAALVLAVTGVAFVATRPQAGGPAVSAPPAAAPSMAPTVSPTPGPTPTFDCAAETTGCSGVLSPGEHESTNLVVPIRFTVPAEWINERDQPRTYAMSTLVGNAGDLQVLALNAIADPRACGPVPLEGAGVGVQDYIDHLQSHPGLTTEEPAPASLGGYGGQSIDFAVASDWTQECPDIEGNQPFALLLTSTEPDPGRAIGLVTGIRARWFVIDVEGETIIVEIVGPQAESLFQIAVDGAMEVLDTLVFEPGN